MPDKYTVKLDEIIEETDRLLINSNYSVQSALGSICSAGGISIWAHPFVGYAAGEKQQLSILEVSSIAQQLKRLNLHGIETEYRDFSDTQKTRLRVLSQKCNFITSGGSDFHGYNGRDLFANIPGSMISILNYL